MAKAKEHFWKRRDGKSIKITEMENEHLANSMKMLGRIWKDNIKSNNTFKALSQEAKSRKFVVIFFKNPIQVNGKDEYLDIFIPIPLSKLSTSIIPSDWDSRLQE